MAIRMKIISLKIFIFICLIIICIVSCKNADRSLWKIKQKGKEYTILYSTTAYTSKNIPYKITKEKHIILIKGRYLIESESFHKLSNAIKYAKEIIEEEVEATKNATK
jgi:hypothetical protein